MTGGPRSRAADIAPLIDLPQLTALHFAALFLTTGENEGGLADELRGRPRRAPPRLHAVGWDLDHACERAPATTRSPSNDRAPPIGPSAALSERPTGDRAARHRPRLPPDYLRYADGR